MSDKPKDEMKTTAMFPGYYYEFDRKGDENFADAVLMEVVEVNDGGEIQIKFTASGFDEYVQFRLKDLQRAVKEFER